MKSFFVFLFLLATSNLAFSSQAYAVSKTSKYLLNCASFQTAGYSSYNSCLRDGRWHQVDVSAVYDLSQAGASVKIVAPPQNLYTKDDINKINPFPFNGSERCVNVYRSNSTGLVHCLGSVRMGGEGPLFTQDTARYSSDGMLCAVNSGSICLHNVVLKWFVKF